RRFNESHQRRLSVEIGRVRRALAGAGVGAIVAERRAFRWNLGSEEFISLLTPLFPGEAAALRALLSDGAPWAAETMAEVTGKSPGTVQRALAELARRGEVQPIGEGPARRWAAPSAVTPIASQMLLLGLFARG